MARDRLIARRKALGFTQQSLAHAIPCERTTVARWERDETAIAPYHRPPLAAALRWSLDELDHALNGGSENQVAHRWFNVFADLEQSATRFRTYESVLVPGLLQTRDYATAVLHGDRQFVARRMERQRSVTREREPLELVALIDQSVLCRPIGGPEVLLCQLDHLAEMSYRPNVTIQVVPFSAPVQPFATGSVVILSFDWGDGLVYLQHRGGAAYLDNPAEVGEHVDHYDGLTELALSPAESVEMITARAKELT